MYNVAHHLQIKVDFLDVLLYTRQESGGINEAIKMSLVPILDHMKELKEREEKAQQRSPNDAQILPGLSSSQGQEFPDRNHNQNDSHTSIASILKSGIGSTSVHCDGVRITIVPGGATRLTENPIIKFCLSKICIGSGITPIRHSQARVLRPNDPILSDLALAV